MEFIKNINEINSSMTDGKENYNLLKKIFSQTTETQIIMLDACGTFYFCNIELLNDVYQLYPYTFNALTEELSKNNNPIMRIEKTHSELIDDIVDMNNKEKFYTFTIVTSNDVPTKRQATSDETIVIKRLLSSEDYLSPREKRQRDRKNRVIRHIDVTESESDNKDLYSNNNNYTVRKLNLG